MTKPITKQQINTKSLEIDLNICHTTEKIHRLDQKLDDYYEIRECLELIKKYMMIKNIDHIGDVYKFYQDVIPLIRKEIEDKDGIFNPDNWDLIINRCITILSTWGSNDEE